MARPVSAPAIGSALRTTGIERGGGDEDGGVERRKGLAFGEELAADEGAEDEEEPPVVAPAADGMVVAEAGEGGEAGEREECEEGGEEGVCSASCRCGQALGEELEEEVGGVELDFVAEGPEDHEDVGAVENVLQVEHVGGDGGVGREWGRWWREGGA